MSIPYRSIHTVSVPTYPGLTIIIRDLKLRLRNLRNVGLETRKAAVAETEKVRNAEPSDSELKTGSDDADADEFATHADTDEFATQDGSDVDADAHVRNMWKLMFATCGYSCSQHADAEVNQQAFRSSTKLGTEQKSAVMDLQAWRPKHFVLDIKMHEDAQNEDVGAPPDVVASGFVKGRRHGEEYPKHPYFDSDCTFVKYSKNRDKGDVDGEDNAGCDGFGEDIGFKISKMKTKLTRIWSLVKEIQGTMRSGGSHQICYLFWFGESSGGASRSTKGFLITGIVYINTKRNCEVAEKLRRICQGDQRTGKC
ncbi:hypothetical protein LXL04_020513 [Taraxacum kok-saghyz]